MNATICYLGDDHLSGAAAYLAGVMAHCGLPVDRVDSSDAPPAVRRTRSELSETGSAWRRPTQPSDGAMPWNPIWWL